MSLNGMESLRLLRVLFLFSLSYYSGVLFGDNDRNPQLVQRSVALKFVGWTSGSFLQTDRHESTTRYCVGPTQYACDWRGTLVPLNKRICMLIGEYDILRVLSCFGVDPI